MLFKTTFPAEDLDSIRRPTKASRAENVVGPSNRATRTAVQLKPLLAEIARNKDTSRACVEVRPPGTAEPPPGQAKVAKLETRNPTKNE